MATEVAAAVPPPQLDAEENSGLEAAAAEAKIQPSSGPHKLERKWTFWFDNQSKPKQGAAWGSSLRKAYTFETVQEFWWYASHNLNLIPISAPFVFWFSYASLYCFLLCVFRLFTFLVMWVCADLSCLLIGN